MVRTLGTVLTGVALGAGLAGLYVVSRSDVEINDRSIAPTSDVAPSVGAAVGLRPAESEDNSEPNLDSLISQLRAAASDPKSTGRTLSIAALLAKLSAIDPAYTAETALSLGLGDELVATAFALWTESDPDAAIARAAAISGSARLRQRVALAVLDALGGDERSLDRITAVLPASDARPLWLEWFSSRANIDPASAMTTALAIDDSSLQQDAIRIVAGAWAAHDPVGALAKANELGNLLGETFRQRLVIDWARLDRASYAAWLQTQTQPDDALLQGMEYLQLSDPEWVIKALASIDGDPAQRTLARAIGSLAETDPAAASAMFDTTAPGRTRDIMAQRIIFSLGRTDPAAAVAWIDSIDSPPPGAIAQFANEMASTDYALMLDLADRLPANDTAYSGAIIFGTINAIGRHPERIPEYADLLLEREDGSSRQMLGRVVADWLDRDLEAALGWVQTHSDSLSSSSLSMAAGRMADSDYVAAVEFVSRIPEQQRAGWVVPTAAAFGSSDAERAALWAAQYRSRDYYVPAMAEIVLAAAETGQSQADALLERHVTNEDVRRQIRERMDRLLASPLRGLE
jgi:hypothetical protein